MNLVRAAVTVSGLTLLSRITGLIRENLTASVFGASALTDAFFVAFRIPNLLRRLFAEGAFSQAFVPILAEFAAREPRQRTRELIDHSATALFWALLATTILGVAASPVLVYLMASGLAQDPEAQTVAVTMTRWMFPYILCISLVALGAGVLNTFKQFSVPAFSPVLLNVSFIGAALFLSDYFDPPIYALAVGVLVGGVAQLLWQVPALLRLRLLPRIGLDLRRAYTDAQTRRILGKMGPAALAVSVAQISLIVNTHIASRLAPGSVSWISFGDRLMEFPTALLGVALGTVMLPSLSRAAARDDHAEFSGLLDWGLRLTVMLSLPAMAGLGLMAEPLTALLFHYGRFDAHDVAMTRLAVLGYSVGLIGLIAIKVLAPGFYAKQDVRTPVRIALFVLAITQALNLLFVPIFQHAGLTLAISVGALFNAALLLSGLRRRGTYQPLPGWTGFGLKTIAATAAMGLLLGWTVPKVDWIAMGTQPGLRIAMALGLVAAGAVVYLGVLLALGIRPRDLLRKTRERRDEDTIFPPTDVDGN